MKAAVVQITSKLEPQENLAKLDALIKKAKSSKASTHIFLPEVFYSMSDGRGPTPYLVEKGNEHYENIRALATENKVFLLGGSAATRLGDEVVNRTYSFTPTGEELSSYDKIHLFRISSSDVSLDEATVYTSGKELVDFQLDENWRVGFSTCFDLRFSELYREFYKRKVNLITAASAFTVPTGMAHWETLVRARAIETQSYVVASAQTGIHNDRIQTYGHSLIVDPWGRILAQIGDGEGIITATLDPSLPKQIRERIDVTSRL